MISTFVITLLHTGNWKKKDYNQPNFSHGTFHKKIAIPTMTSDLKTVILNSHFCQVEKQGLLNTFNVKMPIVDGYI